MGEGVLTRLPLEGRPDNTVLKRKNRTNFYKPSGDTALSEPFAGVPYDILGGSPPVSKSILF